LLLNMSALPEVILLDLHMGVMNGWEFLDWYEKWAAGPLQHPPVFVLSSSLSDEDLERSETYTSVKGYIVKPMTVQHLKDITAKCSQ
jgi:CheY-like chemotaxis protein